MKYTLCLGNKYVNADLGGHEKSCHSSDPAPALPILKINSLCPSILQGKTLGTPVTFFNKRFPNADYQEVVKAKFDSAKNAYVDAKKRPGV